jgi:hypothetical protein
MHTPELKLTLQGCSLQFCHLSFVSDPPSSSLAFVVANEQGGDGGESVDGTDRTSDSMVNDALSSIGG